jgi:DNA helicase-2/ATP-dependent DNA helicase PcrA
MTFRLSDLNPQQREAVKIMNGPLLLLAGAGTGKTRVITYRIAYLVAQGVAPANILAVTFTNKAAREMKERLAALLTPEQAGPITASTFHSFCARILRARIRLLGYSSHFQIAADGYQVGLVRTIMSEMGSLREGFSARDCLNMISSAKSRLLLPGDINLSAEGWPSDLPEIYRRYQAQMKNMDMVDFDDLLLLVILLWRQFPDVLAEYQERCRYILIDEYQDTNPVQFQLVAMLAEKHRNICAVGDDDQSIYGWRGADLANILRFEDHFPAARVIRLEQNYRSTNIILQAANGVIARNQERHGKNLWSGKGEGEKILVVQTADERSEAEFVADFVRDRRALRGGDYNQFAVLYRSNHQSRVFEEAFRQAHVPYRLVGSRSFYERKEIMDAVSYLCAVQNPRDDLNLLRILNVPPRGMGEKAVEGIAAHHRPPPARANG